VPLFPRILPSLQPVANAADEESILDPNCRRLVPQALSVCALKANLRLGSNALAAIGHRAPADMVRYACAMACTSETSTRNAAGRYQPYQKADLDPNLHF